MQVSFRVVGLIDISIDRWILSRMAGHWNSCEKYLKQLDCIEPNARSLETDAKIGNHKDTLKRKFNLKKQLDPYDWRSLKRAYKLHCEIAKIRSKINPFGRIQLI